MRYSRGNLDHLDLHDLATREFIKRIIILYSPTSIFLRQLDGVILVLTCMHMYVLACMHIMHIRRLVDSNPLKLNRTNRTFRVDIGTDRTRLRPRFTISNRPFAVVGSKLIYYSMDTKGGRSLVLTDLEKCIGTNAVMKNVCILGIMQDPHGCIWE